MHKVFLCEYVHPKAVEALREFSEIIEDWDRIGEVEAVFSRNLQLSNEILDRAKNLRVIGIHGTGIDGVDLGEAEKRGIKVFSVPHQNADSVAELIAGYAVALARRFHQAGLMRLAGFTENAPAALKGVELRGKTAGFVGVGAIAQKAAGIFAHGFGMKAIGYSRSFSRERAEGTAVAYRSSLEEVLAEADFVSIGVPLTPQTRGMIGESEFKRMKPSAYLINTSRGAVIDEEALYRALLEGWIAGAACDVFAVEPPPKDSPLLSLPNLIATPHIAANTEEALCRIGMAVADGIRKDLCGK